MKTFVANDGIAPQIEVAIKRIVDRSIEYLRPTLSASIPQTIDPRTVPDIAMVGSNAPAVFVRPYSFKRPGMMNPIVAGFMISTVMARVSTADSFVCAGDQSALCNSSKYAVFKSDLHQWENPSAFQLDQIKLNSTTLREYYWSRIHFECHNIM